MPRRTRKTVLVETPTDSDQLPALTRQGTFTKTPDGSPPKTDSEAQENTSPPARATRGRARKNKKSGSPPKPTRTMPKRGRRHVQFSEYVQTISGEAPEIKENLEPGLVESLYSSPPRETRKKTRRGKRNKEDDKTLVRDGAPSESPLKDVMQDVPGTRESLQNEASTTSVSVDPVTENSSEEIPTAPVDDTKKRSRRGKRSKEEPNIPQSLVREGTFTKSPKKNDILDTNEKHCASPKKRGSKGKSGRAKRSKEEPSVDPGVVPDVTSDKSTGVTSCPEPPQKSSEEEASRNSADEASDSNAQAGLPGLNREGTFTKSPDAVQMAEPPNKTDRKRKRSSYTVVPSTEEGTPGDPASVTPIQSPKRPHIEEENDVSQRRATFIKTPRRSKRSSPVHSEQENIPSGIQREGTFTKSSEKEPESYEAGQNTGVPELKREGTFTKTPEKQDSVIVDFQARINHTPDPIENMSVFQRLSAKIPLSDRRSLLSSRKRASARNNFYTPQIDKKAQLSALRDARKNHLTPKSITFRKRTTPTTPAQPVNVAPSSTKKPKSAVKKPPNFAAIHERNFAKMESLMANKERLRERANFFMSPLRPAQASGIPKLVKKGVSPVRKAPAKKSNIPVMKMAAKERLKAAVASKCPTGALLKAQDSKVLKGVRTNKRFELLLKQKNLKK